jgi:hypothetical protein
VGAEDPTAQAPGAVEIGRGDRFAEGGANRVCGSRDSGILSAENWLTDQSIGSDD